jgi:hypothetical protein
MTATMTSEIQRLTKREQRQQNIYEAKMEALKIQNMIF